MATRLPFTLTQGPARVPVLLSVPHAGRAYPPALLAASRLPRSALAMLEDPLVDRLVEPAVGAGASAIVAHAPRAEIDLNRSLADLDPMMVAPPGRGGVLSRRACAGLGLIPTRLAGHGEIWRTSLAARQVDQRIETIHRPYHDAIAARLAAMRARFGVAVLIDCHSMPPRPGVAACVVFGDRHGTSASDAFVSAAEAACAASGTQSVRNEPYAGGEVVRRHGAPADGIHAIQVEIDRTLYLAEDLYSAGPGFARIAALIAAIVEAVAAAAMPHPLLVAAE